MPEESRLLYTFKMDGYISSVINLNRLHLINHSGAEYAHKDRIRKAKRLCVFFQCSRYRFGGWQIPVGVFAGCYRSIRQVQGDLAHARVIALSGTTLTTGPEHILAPLPMQQIHVFLLCR